MARRKTPKTCKHCSREFWGGTNSQYCDDCRFLTKICPVCECIFTVNRSHNTLTCSCKCGAIIRWQHAERERGQRRPPCGYCGGPVTRKCIGYGKKKAKHLFCSLNCYGRWRTENIRGAKHPRWRGGWEPYYGRNWRSQRRKARKRDEYMCQHCGTTAAALGHAVPVHHIVPFREFGLAKYEEANALSNLISLCPSCHSRRPLL